MATQGQILLNAETPLATSENVANVAVNQAEAVQRAALNVDGKEISPKKVYTDELQLKTALTVGSGVRILDGTIEGKALVGGSVDTDQLAAGAVTADKASISTLSSLTANLGSVNAGSMVIGTGQVAIGDATSGIGIQGNKITCIKSGVAIITIDGDAGTINARKFTLTSDAGNSLDLTLGTHYFKDGIQVGGVAGVTLGTMKTAIGAAASDASTAYGASQQASQDAATANGNANSRILKSQAYVGLTGENITRIDLSGLTIGTQVSNARVEMNYTGLAIYDANNNLKTWMDTNGFHCRRGNTVVPGLVERASFYDYGGTEYGFVSVGKDAHGGLVVAGLDGGAWLAAGLVPAGTSGWTYSAYAAMISAGDGIDLIPAKASGGSNLVRIGNPTNASKNLEVWGWAFAYHYSFMDSNGTEKNTIWNVTADPTVGSDGDIALDSRGDLWLHTGGVWKKVSHA